MPGPGDKLKKFRESPAGLITEILLGLTPAGPAIDAADLADATRRGDKLDMALAGIGFLPVAGDALKTFGRTVSTVLERGLKGPLSLLGRHSDDLDNLEDVGLLTEIGADRLARMEPVPPRGSEPAPGEFFDFWRDYSSPGSVQRGRQRARHVRRNVGEYGAQDPIATARYMREALLKDSDIDYAARRKEFNQMVESTNVLPWQVLRRNLSPELTTARDYADLQPVPVLSDVLQTTREARRLLAAGDDAAAATLMRALGEYRNRSLQAPSESFETYLASLLGNR